MGCMQSDAQLAPLVASLDGATPPKGLSGPLLGVWRALRGEWDAAHDAVQDDTVECSWVHAALHREAGDHGNAGYWYRLASRPVAKGDIRVEYLAIASELLNR
jgi:hypothetical protein